MNLQNIPRDDKTIKQAFIPKLDCLFFADYKAIEYRVTAYYMAMIGYGQWADNFRQGVDPHEQTAKMLGSDDRQFGKKFNFASIYGAGVGELRDQLKEAGLTVPAGKTVKQLHAQFHETNPGIRALSWPDPLWPDKDRVPGAIEHRLRAAGLIRTLWGRELHPIPYKALNALVQGCSADLMRASMVNVHGHLARLEFQSHIVMSVHDELIFDCVTSEVPYLASQLKSWMSDVRLTNVVPIEIELEISHKTWADKESYGN